MYIVTNLTTHEQTAVDAIETVIYDAESGAYIPSENPDGFRALTIVHISPTEERYDEVVYAFEGHTLSGVEPTGKYELQEADDE